MNLFAVNGGSVNSSGVVAQYSYLSSSTAVLSIDAAEYHADLMAGIDTISITSAGNITKLSQIGAVAIGMSFDTSATISSYTARDIGSVTTNAIGIDGSTFLYGMVMIPTSSDSMSISSSANAFKMYIQMAANDAISVGSTGLLQTMSQLYATDQLSIATSGTIGAMIRMSSSDGLSIDTSGNLSALVRSYMSSPANLISIGTTGVLSMIGHLQASDQLSVGVSGMVSNMKRMSASDSLSVGSVGNLTVNPTAQDIESNTMYRPFVERTMDRQS